MFQVETVQRVEETPFDFKGGWGLEYFQEKNKITKGSKRSKIFHSFNVRAKNQNSLIMYQIVGPKNKLSLE